MIEEIKFQIEKGFQKVHSILITNYEVDMEYPDSYVNEETRNVIYPSGVTIISETNILKSELPLSNKGDIADLKANLSLIELTEEKSFIREYNIKLYDEEKKNLLEIDLSHQCNFLRVNMEESYYQIALPEKFTNWISFIYKGHNGIKDGKIVGCEILSWERDSFNLKSKKFQYSHKEKESIKRMAQYIKAFYRDNKYGKDEYDADETPECCIASYEVRELSFPSKKKKRIKKTDLNEDYEILNINLEKTKEEQEERQREIDDFALNPPRKVRICSESGVKCPIDIMNIKSFRIDHKIRKQSIKQDEINREFGKSRGFPVIHRFYIEYDTFYYSICYDYKIEFDEKEPFGLFFAFKMRNTKPSKIYYWLDYFFQINGDVFVDFVKNNLLDYKHLFKGKSEIKKAIKGWSKNTKNRKPSSNGKIGRKTDKEVILTINLNDKFRGALLSDIKMYFDKTCWSNLNLILSGILISEKLVFEGDAATLIRVFKFLQENKIVINTKKYLSKWLCDNFQYRKLKEEKPNDFAESTAYQNLKKNSRQAPDSTKVELLNVKKMLNA